MKFSKMILGLAFLVAVSSAFASKKSALVLDNRRDGSASCTPIVGDCNDSGPNECQSLQYPLNDFTCHLQLLKRP
jgi:hypothetical protein